MDGADQVAAMCIVIILVLGAMLAWAMWQDFHNEPTDEDDGGVKDDSENADL